MGQRAVTELDGAARERFAFGDNWRRFAGLVDATRVRDAAESLAVALRASDLTGRMFLDVGCGSGLFSLAAVRLGAQVHAFDADAAAVETAMGLRREFAPDADWTIEQGSILDADYVAKLGTYDVVYSWGVLHHTGDMWRAMDLVRRPVAPGGRLYLSIYNDQGRESRIWRRVKRRYNRSGPLLRRLLLYGSAAYLHKGWPIRAAAAWLESRSRGNRPDPAAPAHPGVPARPAVPAPLAGPAPAPGRGPASGASPRSRAMSRARDLEDWVGGYPFEVAEPGQVFRFYADRGFELRHLVTRGGGIGCNEFVFERPR